MMLSLAAAADAARWCSVGAVVGVGAVAGVAANVVLG